MDALLTFAEFHLIHWVWTDELLDEWEKVERLKGPSVDLRLPSAIIRAAYGSDTPISWAAVSMSTRSSSTLGEVILTSSQPR